jgi:hypothetical protein
MLSIVVLVAGGNVFPNSGDETSGSGKRSTKWFSLQTGQHRRQLKVENEIKPTFDDLRKVVQVEALCNVEHLFCFWSSFKGK